MSESQIPLAPAAPLEPLPRKFMLNMKYLFLACILFASSLLASAASVHLERRGGHRFTLVNKCHKSIKPVVADTSCGYSPRCSDAGHYTGKQPGELAAGKSTTLNIPSKWVGRIFAQNGKCGAKGEGCTMTEFNLDTGNSFTPQAYDISNIQGFTQSVSIGAAGCDTVKCTDKNCGCKNAYPIGDMSGCGNDSPVRGCKAGDIAFTITFCP